MSCVSVDVANWRETYLRVAQTVVKYAGIIELKTSEEWREGGRGIYMPVLYIYRYILILLCKPSVCICTLSAAYVTQPHCYTHMAGLPSWRSVNLTLSASWPQLWTATRGTLFPSLCVRTPHSCLLTYLPYLLNLCLQPATNTQSSKPRPPTTNTKSKGKLQNKIKHCKF